MTAFVVISAIGLGTYDLRASMFVLAGAHSLPARLDDAVRLVDPAAVAALMATMIFSRAGSIDLQPAPELVAIVVGYVFVRRTGNVVERLPRRTPDPVGTHTAARPSRPW